ncbi:hypothetical protein B566_EDAN018415 [Ephemera danica]|nr:hypothetical protein B566_EDAN018415 [Ephemera danica]
MIFGLVSSILIIQALPTETNEVLSDPPLIETRGALLELFGLGFLTLRVSVLNFVYNLNPTYS